MKKSELLKKFITFGLTVGITAATALGAVACTVDSPNTPVKDPNEIVIPNPPEEIPDDPIIDPVDPDKKDPETPPVVDPDEPGKEDPENPGEDPEPPTEDEEKLFDEQGNPTALFANTIKDWMNDGYINNKLMIGNFKCTIDDFDYISTKEEEGNIVMGAYVTDFVGENGTKSYRKFKIISAELVSKILNGEFDNSSDLVGYLNTLTGKPITLTGSMDYESTTNYANRQEKAELFTMAENILIRLQEVGYQGSSINNEGTKVNDYAGATILSVRKTNDNSSGGSAYDMGRVALCDYVILVERTNGGLEEVTVNAVSKSDFGSQNILNNVKDSWMINKYSSKEIDYCPYTENTAQYAFVVDDEAYLIR